MSVMHHFESKELTFSTKNLFRSSKEDLGMMWLPKTMITSYGKMIGTMTMSRTTSRSN